MRIIPTWEKPTCVRSRLGRTLRIREAQAAHSHTMSHIERERLARTTSQLGRKRRVQAANTALSGTTSRLGRNRPEQDPASGERQNRPSRLPGQTPGRFSAREGNSLPNRDVAPNRAGFASQTREFLPSRDVAPNEAAFAPQICDLLPRRDLAQPRLVQSGDKSSVVLDGTRSKPWLSARPKH